VRRRRWRLLADFVGVLDKFSAIGSFDADSPSAPPSTCVQIEGFRESCDIPSRRRGRDRENARNEKQAKIGEPERRKKERFRRDGKVREGMVEKERKKEKGGKEKRGMGWYVNVSLHESWRNGEIAAWKLQRTLAMFTATRSESSRFFSQR